MNKKEVIKVIRQIIREEVKREVKSVVSQMLNEQTTFKQTQVDDTSWLVKGLSNKMKPKPKVQPRNYSSDSILNSVLNETAENMTRDDYVEQEYDMDSIGGNFERLDDEIDIPYARPTKLTETLNMTPRQPQPRTGLGVKTGNEGLDTALNRDYTSLMKKYLSNK